MTSRGHLVAVGIAAGILAAWAAAAQQPPARKSAAPPAPASPVPIATVGSLAIARDEFQGREAQAMSEYRKRLGQEVPAEVRPVVRRQLLESLIRRELLALEAARRGIVGTEAEAEEQVRKEPFFNPDGRFDPQRFELIKTSQPENYARAIAQFKAQLGAMKLADQIEKDYGGDPAALRAAAERSLGHADYDVIALKRSEVVGAIREPRESEVIDAFRSRADEWKRPAEAHLAVLVVDQPPLTDSLEENAAAVQSWTQKMRARADSALAAARGGSSFEDLARVVGSIRHDVVVTADNFPGFWRGDGHDATAVFAARSGSLLGTPVRGVRGWLVVRVDQQLSEHGATLAEVARQVRGSLRTEARNHGDERELRARYESQKDHLATTAWKIRYAVFDTSAAIPDPAPAELDRWYRAHQADFSSFDAAAGMIRIQPLAGVRDRAVIRWKSERRREGARLAANTLVESWKKGARDRTLERGARLLREVGPLVSDAPVDTGLAGKVLSDTLAGRPWGLGAGMIPYGPGWVVYHLYESVPKYTPDFEQVRARLAADLSRERAEAEEKGARELYDRHPESFAAKNVIMYTRLMVERPNPLNVPLTRAQVERYYREHLDRYSAPEQVRVRHILIAPAGNDPAAIDRAREKAQGILERVRAGEDFATLARRYSDDVATRESGGDLGDFGRGSMLPAFEDAAFRMQPGDISDLVRTEVGFHILKCTSHLPIYAQELKYVYANVGWDCAVAASESLSVRRADSLSAAIRTPEQGRAAAAKMKVALDYAYHEIGDRRTTGEMASFVLRLERTRPGQVVPGTGFEQASGRFVAWVDSIVPAFQRSYDRARPAALDQYRRGASQRALDAKRAELDSLMAAGWSADSIAALWGGWDKVRDAAPGTGVSGMGGSDQVDSLVFGTVRRPPALQDGQLSGWIDVPGGLARLRLERRKSPDPARVAALVENERRIQVEQKLQAFFEDLKKRYPVKILDEKLRDTPLPPPPASKLQ